jgi:hypothetical protein
MRGLATGAIALMAALGTVAPAFAQSEPGPQPLESVLTPVVKHLPITPLGMYAIGSIGGAAVAPIVGTIILGRELTPSEVYRLELSILLGPVGWWLGNRYFPDAAGGGNPLAHARNINIPPAGETHFVPNEVLLEFYAGTSAQYLDRLARSLELTPLETQTFALTGRTLQRWRIDGPRSVASILRALAAHVRISVAQPNYLYLLQQGAPALTREPPNAGAAPYVVNKLHLLEAHQISTGDNVLVAVIDSKIDTSHPDLAGVVTAEFDALGGLAPPHPHGTGIAGAIAAHAKLIGVAPKVKLLAARVFSGSGESAQGTSFNILKGLDWAAGNNARIVNMSFAGPNDAMIRNMIAKAHARGMVLIAAVGNAGPRSAPLYPAAYAEVIGVTATDAMDKLLPQANRGRQVAVAAPGVDVLVPAPDGNYQLTTGTSIAAASVSGVAALLLARNPALTPGTVKNILTGTAHPLSGPARDFGAGEIDALAALRALTK